MKRTAVIRPGCTGSSPEMEEPLGAEAICGYLRSHGAECRVFDRLLPNTGIGELERYAPLLVGFSLMTEGELPDALRLLQLLRQPGRIFFAGGLFITNNLQRARAAFPKDVVLLSGEGERQALALVRGAVPEPEDYPEPDEWSFAARDSMQEYLIRGGVINLRTARGCRGSCAFCSTPGLPAALRSYRARSIPLVAEEMEALIRQGYAPVFNFTDDDFGRVERIQELCTELRRRSIRVSFSLELRAAELLRPERFDWMSLHEDGLCRIFTGLESVNTATQDRWGKRVDPEALFSAIHDLQKAGIVCAVGYILWHPDATPESARQEAERLYAEGLLTPKAALSRLILFPGSRLSAQMGIRETTAAPLPAPSAAEYARWERLLLPLREVWSTAAAALPGAACRAHLTGETEQLAGLTALEQEINEICHTALISDTAPGADLIKELERRAYAFSQPC